MSLEQYMNQSFDWVAYGTLVLAVPVFLLLLIIKAPYGRHVRKGWGPMLDNRLGWFFMELPSVLVFGAILLFYAKLNLTTLAFLFLWQIHYCHRALIYPWTLKKQQKMPWLILVIGVIFNSTNGYLNAWSIAYQSEKYSDAWLSSPQFIIGVLIFFCGMILNKLSDRILSGLSSENGGYRIPHGLAYRWVSCPNYLGEIIQWTGWAIATWSLAGWVFAIWTMANLVPRALAHHRWYRENFKDYPAKRRALIPFVL